MSDQVVVAEEPMAVEAPDDRGRRRGRRRWALVVVAVLVVVGFVAISPGPGPALRVRDPSELLEDASFELAGARGGAWTDAATSRNPIALLQRGAFEGRRYAVLRPVAGRQLIRQDIALGARDGRSYRATAYVRAEAAAPVDGVLTAATNCADPERTRTRFTARPGTWAPVSATLTPRRGARCSLRFEIALAADATAAIGVDAPSLTDAGLADASFETTPLRGWEVNNHPEATVLSVVRDGAALDGSSVGRVRTRTRLGSVAQDVVLDPSSEQVVATLSLSVRRAPVAGAAGDGPAGEVPVSVALWLRCPDEKDRNQVVAVRAGAAWQRATVRLRTPGPLIRPNGDACSLRAEVYVDAAGAVVDLDGAELAVRSARPATS